jgi:hypothetical protein
MGLTQCNMIRRDKSCFHLDFVIWAALDQGKKQVTKKPAQPEGIASKYSQTPRMFGRAVNGLASRRKVLSLV